MSCYDTGQQSEASIDPVLQSLYTRGYAQLATCDRSLLSGERMRTDT